MNTIVKAVQSLALFSSVSLVLTSSSFAAVKVTNRFPEPKIISSFCTRVVAEVENRVALPPCPTNELKEEYVSTFVETDKLLAELNNADVEYAAHFFGRSDKVSDTYRQIKYLYTRISAASWHYELKVEKNCGKLATPWPSFNAMLGDPASSVGGNTGGQTSTTNASYGTMGNAIGEMLNTINPQNDNSDTNDTGMGLLGVDNNEEVQTFDQQMYMSRQAETGSKPFPYYPTFCKAKLLRLSLEYQAVGNKFQSAAEGEQRLPNPDELRIVLMAIQDFVAQNVTIPPNCDAVALQYAEELKRLLSEQSVALDKYEMAYMRSDIFEAINLYMKVEDNWEKMQSAYEKYQEAL